MHAILYEGCPGCVRSAEISVGEPHDHQILIRVRACGVCRTDLHLIDGELPEPKLPVVPGHEVVGTVAARGKEAMRFGIGERVGVPWLGNSCRACLDCAGGHENLCDRARFTGYQIDGGYAEYIIADERYCFHLPETYTDHEAAPLLCAGLIGYRAYKFTGSTRVLGIYGFGAAAHIVAQIARHQDREVYAFTRPGDLAGQAFAIRHGARWAGGSDERAPVTLDAAILFAPVGDLIPAALGAVRKGGTVVCAGIHMSTIPSFPYSLLWGERCVRSVANLTRADGEEFLALAPSIPVRTDVSVYALADATRALRDLRDGRITGAAVLSP